MRSQKNICIGKVLARKQKKKKQKNEVHVEAEATSSLNSIEEQIAALERDLAEDSDASETSKDDSHGDESTGADSSAEVDESVDEQEENKMQKGKKRKGKAKCGRRGGDDEKNRLDREDGHSPEVIALSSLEEDRIKPLPVHYLPLPQAKAKQIASSRKQPAGRGDGSMKGFGKPSGLEQAVNELLSNYEPTSAERRPFYCRICRYQGNNNEDLKRHRSSDFHRMAAEKERKLSFCRLCKKQFTSPAQLQEHVQGKAHKDRLQSLQTKQGMMGAVSKKTTTTKATP